jgi:hypothetical protein
MEFFQKVWTPLKFKPNFKLDFLPGYFNWNHGGNLNFFPKGKMFLLNLYFTMQSLGIFGTMEVSFSYVTSWISLLIGKLNWISTGLGTLKPWLTQPSAFTAQCRRGNNTDQSLAEPHRY